MASESQSRSSIVARLLAPDCTECDDPIVGPRSFAGARPYHPGCLEPQIDGGSD